MRRWALASVALFGATLLVLARVGIPAGRRATTTETRVAMALKARPMEALKALAPLAANLPAAADTLEREDFLSEWARSFFPGRSGDIMFVPERGEIFTTAGDPNHPFQHGTPWDYDARIPVVLYGPGHIRQGTYRGAVSLQDVGATMAHLVGLSPRPTTTGRVLEEALLPGATPPRVLVLLMLDGFRADYADRYADQTTALRRLRSRGAYFEEARLNYLPTVTAVAHTTVSTATDPAIHGITDNSLFDRARGRGTNALAGASARNVMVLTLTDRWQVATEGRAVMAAQGGTYYAAAALAGHGGCLFDERPWFLSYYDARTGGWATNPDCYRLPEVIEGRTVDGVWEPTGGVWLGHQVGNRSEVRRSALFASFEGDAVVDVLRALPFGEDEVTDLFLVNLKTTDYVGHKYGPFSPEIRDAVAAVDRQVGRVVEALRERAGPEGFVLVISADHGMEPEPRAPHARRDLKDVVRLVNRRFDPEGKGVVRYYPYAGKQLFLDRGRLASLGVSPEAVARYLEGLPYIRAAFTAREVRQAQVAVLRR
ncbi:MAG: alkaline phosphatase family protein [Gemmatimonadota bacterium]